MADLPIIWSPLPGFQKAALKRGEFESLWGGAAGPGKGLALDTPILTPQGFVLMGDLVVGDRVVAPDGTWAMVTHVTEPVERTCYRLTFDDGSTLVADDVHRWMVLTPAACMAQTRQTNEWRLARRARRKSRATSNGEYTWLAERNTAKANAVARKDAGPWDGAVMMTTQEIAEYVGRPLAIPVTDPVQGKDYHLPLDPYVLGAWLGDGTSAGIGFTQDERNEWVVNQIRSRGFEVRKWGQTNAYGIQGIASRLRDLGVLGNKHIPELYQRATVGERRLILAGLMDTDGSVGKDGCCEYTGTSEVLVRGVLRLARSLGFKATIRTKMARCQNGAESPAWRVTWCHKDTPITMPHKAARIPQRNRPTVRRRYIISIDLVPTVPTRCIAVEHPSRCYLAGESLIPTHNTDCLIAVGARYAQHPKATGLFLRTNFTDMRDVMDRMHVRYPVLGATWKESEKRWTFPSGGTLECGYGDGIGEISRYLGREFTFVLYDELAQLGDEYPWQMLLSRIRSTDPTVPLRARASANPIGPGRDWLKRRFVDVCGKHGETVFLDEETGRTRSYVPGKASDNPMLPQSYWDGLKDLPPSIQQALRDGDWDMALGLFYPELMDSDDLWITAAQVPELKDWHEFWGSYDWGFVHPAVCCQFVRVKETIYWLDTLYMHRFQDEEQAATIKGWADPRCLRMVYAGHDVKASRQAHAAAAETVQDVFARYSINLELANIDRMAGGQGTSTLLRKAESRTPLARATPFAYCRYARQSAGTGGSAVTHP